MLAPATANSPYEDSGVPLSTSTPQKAIIKSEKSTKSPNQMDFCEESKRLIELNDRFAVYIDRVWALENENMRLKQEVSHLKSLNSSRTGEIMNVKSFVERETADLRKLLDETDMQKAKIEIDYNRVWEEKETLQIRFNELEAEYKRVCKKLGQINKTMEEETLARVALENKNKSLHEELFFVNQMFNQGFDSPNKNITKIDADLSRKYETKLQDSLKELREQFEKQCKANRLELTEAFKSRIQQLESALVEAEKIVLKSDQNWKSTVDKMNLNIDMMESRIKQKDALIKNLEQQLEKEIEKNRKDNEASNAEIMRITKDLQHQLESYGQLLDQKLALDNEIMAYDQLLHGEEARFNLTRTEKPKGIRRLIKRPPPKSSLNPGGKRRRVSSEVQDFTLPPIFENPDIQITSTNSGWVLIKNAGKNSVNLGNWKIQQTDNQNSTVCFQFDQNFILEAGARVTILSQSNMSKEKTPKKAKELYLIGADWSKSESKFTLTNNFGKQVSVFGEAGGQESEGENRDDKGPCSVM